MNIGAVQRSDYNVNYAGYTAGGDAKTDAFYSGLSSAVEAAQGRGSGDVLGITTLPYSDSLSYGMSAFYSEKSTPTDPVIRINSNYGGENRYFDVHVNEVNPSNASQLEMFALSCYMDDQGMTDGGTFGSYSRMKSYAFNDACLGKSPNLHSPESVEVRMDWVSMLQRMAEVYLQNAQTYSQYLDCEKLASILEKWNPEIE